MRYFGLNGWTDGIRESDATIWLERSLLYSRNAGMVSSMLSHSQSRFSPFSETRWEWNAQRLTEHSGSSCESFYSAGDRTDRKIVWLPSNEISITFIHRSFIVSVRHLKLRLHLKPDGNSSRIAGWRKSTRVPENNTSDLAAYSRLARPTSISEEDWSVICCKCSMTSD